MYAAAKDDDSKKRIAAMGLALGESIQNAAKPKGAEKAATVANAVLDRVRKKIGY